MWQGRRWLRRKDPRLATWDLRRCLVLLLVLVFSTSGLVHSNIEGHAASAVSGSNEIASVEHRSSVEQPCSDDADDAHGTLCCKASVCSFCVPLTPSATITRAAVAEVVAVLPDEDHPGLAPSPGLRPPSLSANI